MRTFRILLASEIGLVLITFGLFFYEQPPWLKVPVLALFGLILAVLSRYKPDLQARGESPAWDEFITLTMWEFLTGFVSLSLVILGCLAIWFLLNYFLGPRPLFFILYLILLIVLPLAWVYLDPCNKLRTNARRSGLYLLLFFALLYLNKFELVSLITEINFPPATTLRLKFINILVVMVVAADRFWKNVADSYVDWRQKR